jgi:tetratricopeptide (TPR) repeat protein
MLDDGQKYILDGELDENIFCQDNTKKIYFSKEQINIIARGFAEKIVHLRSEITFRDARINLLKNDFENAEALYRRLLSKNNTDAKAYNRLGSLLSLQGKLNEAVEMAAKAVELKPDNVKFWHDLGNIHGKLGNFDEAIGSLQKALELNISDLRSPRNPLGLYIDLGRLFTEKGEFLKAEETFLAVIEIDPEHKEAKELLKYAQNKIKHSLKKLKRKKIIEKASTLIHVARRLISWLSQN